MATADKQRTFEREEKETAEALAAKREERDALVAEIILLEDREKQERKLFHRKNPNGNPYAQGEQPQKLRLKRKKKEQTLDSLDGSIADLQEIANEHAKERSRRDLRERIECNGRHKETQAECLEEAKALLEAVLPVFHRYRDSVSEQRNNGFHVQRTNLPAQADDPELAAAWDLVCDPEPGTPQTHQLTFGRFLAGLLPQDVVEKKPGVPQTSFEFTGENVAGAFGLPVSGVTE